jgi:hypothetical protein
MCYIYIYKRIRFFGILNAAPRKLNLFAEDQMDYSTGWRKNFLTSQETAISFYDVAHCVAAILAIAIFCLGLALIFS